MIKIRPCSKIKCFCSAESKHILTLPLSVTLIRMVRQITVGVLHCQELAKGPLCCVPLQLTHINLKHICSSSVAHLHKTQAPLNIHGNLGASSWSEAHVRKQNFNYYVYNTTARLLIFTAHLFLCQPVSRQMCVCVILANSSSFVTV